MDPAFGGVVMPLREKYQVWRAHKCGKYKNRTGNSHAGKKSDSIWQKISSNATKRRTIQSKLIES